MIYDRPQPVSPAPSQAEGPAPSRAEGQGPVAGAPPTVETPAIAVSPAQERFRSCRWRAPEKGDFCTHRDVLPLAGKEGFNPEAWCPDCAFYKLRRTPKKREYNSGY